MWITMIVMGVLILGIVTLKIKANKKLEAENTELISKIEDNILTSKVVIDDWENIKKNCQKRKLKYTRDIESNINRIINFSLKYGLVLSKTELNMLLGGKYFLNMTEEMLVDAVGKPNKIETEVLKTKTKKTYIYGNKSSGDVLVFENGRLVRFKDR